MRTGVEVGLVAALCLAAFIVVPTPAAARHYCYNGFDAMASDVRLVEPTLLTRLVDLLAKLAPIGVAGAATTSPCIETGTSCNGQQTDTKYGEKAYASVRASWKCYRDGQYQSLSYSFSCGGSYTSCQRIGHCTGTCKSYSADSIAGADGKIQARAHVEG